MRCMDAECGKITCRWCSKPEHSPLKCHEVEKVAQTEWDAEEIVGVALSHTFTLSLGC